MSKIKTISYGKSFEIVTPIGTVWEKIGLEAELGERETPEEGMLELKQFVDFFHVEHHTQYPEQDTFTTVPGTKKQPVKLIPDAMTVASYEKFKRNGNDAMVANLESIYTFPNA